MKPISKLYLRFLETAQYGLGGIAVGVVITFAVGCLGVGIYGPPDTTDSLWSFAVASIAVFGALTVRDARCDLEARGAGGDL